MAPEVRAALRDLAERHPDWTSEVIDTLTRRAADAAWLMQRAEAGDRAALRAAVLDRLRGFGPHERQLHAIRLGIPGR